MCAPLSRPETLKRFIIPTPNGRIARHDPAPKSGGDGISQSIQRAVTQTQPQRDEIVIDREYETFHLIEFDDRDADRLHGGMT
ncbi:hypothetical protein [Caulobacter soli]|uniref:hypothetical protein n=1 Tax=Caulobacter soli TaxID=2708539 RepID=UPI0013E9EFE4|nr:hypothetical protein [Caulobacter soli]